MEQVEKSNLSPSALLDCTTNFNNLKRHFQSPHISNEVLNQCISHHLGNQRYELVFPSQLKYVDDKPDSYKGFSYWTFGTHRSPRTDSKKYYLVGYLYVLGQTGTVYFTDFTNQLPCIITSSEDYDVSKLVGNYVIVEDYVIISEIYNDTSFYSTEYLIINPSAFILLDIENNQKPPPLLQEYLKSLQYKKTEVYIISKSMPTAAQAPCLQLCLEVIWEGIKSFQFLGPCYASIYSTLKPGHEYHLYYKNMSKFSHKEISMLKPNFPLWLLGSGAHFIPTNRATTNKLTILNAEEARNALKSSNLVSFEAVIRLKKFVEPLSSRTVKHSKSSNFGTPGTKTHLLEFEIDGPRLTLYLNNWENMLVPYGLIPDMRVSVHNVKPQSGKYYKSTAMTRIEAVKYEPKIRFESANLYRSDWGQPFFLGVDKLIPRGVIVWVRILEFFVLGLKVKYESAKLSVTITLVVIDALGESKVLATHESAFVLLRVLLGMQKAVFDKFKIGLESLKSYSYSKGRGAAVVPGESETNLKFRNYLTRLVDLLPRSVSSLELLVRKIDEEETKSVYFLIDARRA